MKKYALFLGCTIPVRAQNYELSTRKVAEALGLSFENIDNFSCCGYPVSSIHQQTAEEMAAQIEEVVASAEELSALAEQLREATAQFEIGQAHYEEQSE